MLVLFFPLFCSGFLLKVSANFSELDFFGETFYSGNKIPGSLIFPKMIEYFEFSDWN